MTEHDWKPVATALIGSWPTQVAAWGRETIATYCTELQARGLTPDVAVTAIRQHAGAFPPSGGELAALARQDPDRPTTEELLQGLYGPGGLFGFQRSGVTVSPWIIAFADDYGRERLRLEPVDDPEEGKWARRRIEDAWARFCEATEGRAVAELARRSQTGLSRVDVLEIVRGAREQTQLERGEA